VSFPGIDELLQSVAKLNTMAKKRMNERQGGKCLCQCHDDPSLLHIGKICCETAMAGGLSGE